MQESVKQIVTWIELRIKAGIVPGDSIDSAGDFTDSLGDCGTSVLTAADNLCSTPASQRGLT